MRIADMIIPLLVDIDLAMPPSPGLCGGKHATTTAHVSKGSLSCSVSSTSWHTWDTWHCTSCSPRLCTTLHTCLKLDCIWLPLVLGQICVHLSHHHKWMPDQPSTYHDLMFDEIEWALIIGLINKLSSQVPDTMLLFAMLSAVRHRSYMSLIPICDFGTWPSVQGNILHYHCIAQPRVTNSWLKAWCNDHSTLFKLYVLLKSQTCSAKAWKACLLVAHDIPTNMF